MSVSSSESAWIIEHAFSIAALFFISLIVGAMGPILAYGCTLLDGKGKLAGWRWIFVGVLNIQFREVWLSAMFALCLGHRRPHHLDVGSGRMVFYPFLPWSEWFLDLRANETCSEAYWWRQRRRHTRCHDHGESYDTYEGLDALGAWSVFYGLSLIYLTDNTASQGLCTCVRWFQHVGIFSPFGEPVSISESWSP